jgi:hypothetical protein
MAINVSVEEYGNDPVLVEVALAYPSHTHTVEDISNVVEDIQDVIGAMVEGNVESGISVSYDDTLGKINFDVGDFTLTLDGDVSGTGTVTNLGNATITTTVADNSHNHISTNITDFTEAAQDAAAAMVTAATHAGLTVSYNDVLNTLTFNVNDPVITVTGDVEGSATMTNLGNTTINLELTNTGVTAATYGDANSVSQITVDEDGRITGASNVDVAIAASQVTDFTEAAQDALNNALVHTDHTNIIITYNDGDNKYIIEGAGNVLSVNSQVGDVVLDTDDILEDASPINLWFTDTRAKDSAGDLLENATKTGISIDYENQSLTIENTGVLEVNGTGNQIDATTLDGAVTLSLPNDLIIPQDLTITGNLTVQGETTTVSSQSLSIADSSITLNSDQDPLDPPPTLMIAGLDVKRGTQPDALLFWDEAEGDWFVSEDNGVTKRKIGAVQTVNGFAGTVSLSTDDVDEGINNLYYTEQKVTDRLTEYASGLDTSTLTLSAGIQTVPGTEEEFIEVFALQGNVLSSPVQKVVVRNITLDTIAQGVPLHIDGYTTGSDIPNVIKADSDLLSTMPALGLAEYPILPNETGFMIISGNCEMDTDSIITTSTPVAVGDIVYVSNNSLLTKEPQGFTEEPQRIGVVTKLVEKVQDEITLEDIIVSYGIIFVIGSGIVTEKDRLEVGTFLLGQTDGTFGVPTRFSIENIIVDGYATFANLPDIENGDPGSAAGSYGFVNDTNELFISRGGLGWNKVSFEGHLHESIDINDFQEAVYDEINQFFGSQLTLSGLEFAYDDENNSGTLSLRDPEVTFTVFGDFDGTSTAIWYDLQDIEFTTEAFINRTNLSNYIYDAFNHERHDNITFAIDLEPTDSSQAQIILTAPTPYTQEEIQDFVTPLLNHSNHTNVTVVYDDGPNEILLSVPDSVDLIQFGTRPQVNGNVTVGFQDIISALGYTPLDETNGEKATDLIAPSLAHDNHVNAVVIYDDDNDRIVFEIQTAGAASVGSLTNSWWLGA